MESLAEWNVSDVLTLVGIIGAIITFIRGLHVYNSQQTWARRLHVSTGSTR